MTLNKVIRSNHLQKEKSVIKSNMFLKNRITTFISVKKHIQYL